MKVSKNIQTFHKSINIVTNQKDVDSSVKSAEVEAADLVKADLVVEDANNLKKNTDVDIDDDSEDEFLTAAQHSQKRKERTEIEAKIAKEHASMSYRERINQFNQKLAAATEHNDIPRISAAGNG